MLLNQTYMPKMQIRIEQFAKIQLLLQEKRGENAGTDPNFFK